MHILAHYFTESYEVVMTSTGSRKLEIFQISKRISFVEKLAVKLLGDIVSPSPRDNSSAGIVLLGHDGVAVAVVTSPRLIE